MHMDETITRREIVAAAQAMNALGINQGTSGNISVRAGASMLITPSATPYDAMRADDIAAMPLDGNGIWTGPLKPSTEWRMHLDILRGRSAANAIVHTHAPYCTTLSILRRGIPAIHYMMAAFGGTDIRCAPYANFGTAELARLALIALEGRQGCLLANHGMVVVGPTLAKAMWLAVELETLARLYCLSLQTGTPHLLSDAELAEAAASFSTYGLREPATVTDAHDQNVTRTPPNPPIGAAIL
jgi:L-fuculose-phosphate aldolase